MSEEPNDNTQETQPDPKEEAEKTSALFPMPQRDLPKIMRKVQIPVLSTA